MKKLLCVLLFALTCITYSSAQSKMQSVYEIRHAFDFYLHHKSNTAAISANSSANDVRGSAYLNDDFIEGTVYTTSKTKFVAVPLRYNIYNDQVEFRNAEGQIFAIATPEVIEKIEIGECKIEYIPIQASTKVSKSFLEVLEKGEASLYCRQKVILEQAQSAGAYKAAQPARFIRKADEYYIRIGKEAAKPISKKRDLQNIFSHKGKDINAYIKNNKIRPGNIEALRELVIYYNSL